MEILRQFEDKDGATYELWDRVWTHIQEGHPEIQSPDEIGRVLKEPDLIVRSNWNPAARLYYRRRGKYYRVVVVDTNLKRVKTAYLTNKVKSGEVLWSRT